MPAAARVTDMHTCPMFNGPSPHVGESRIATGGYHRFDRRNACSESRDIALCAGPFRTQLLRAVQP